MFLKNSFTEEYFSIIQKYKEEHKDIVNKKDIGYYCERHHIVPKSLGGNNTRDNIVFLPAQEHFRCHQLLVNMTNGEAKSKMWSGLWRMMNKQSRNQDRDFSFSLEEYEEARLNHALTHSERMSGEKNYFYNKTHSNETKKKMSKARKGKTYEEIFGEEAGKIMREKRRKETLGKKRSRSTCEKIRQLKLGKKRPDILKRCVSKRIGLYQDIIAEIEKQDYYRGMHTRISETLTCDKELVSKVYKDIAFYKELIKEIQSSNQRI